ncbi:MAG: alanine--tRNA ligase [Patescibacteria group bacterium]
MFSSKEILNKYLNFFKDKGHKQVPNVSLVPENDPTLLFVNSGMFPLVPYLSGELHPLGKKILNVQRCLRFDDLEEVGDYNHTVAFHMVGNWSLGDYFKSEQLPWIWEFMVEVLKLDINKMYASVFEGDDDAPRDEESIKIITQIYKKYGIDAKVGERIFAYGKKDNWWKRGDAIGELGGPDSEIFYYVGKDGNGLGKNPAQNESEFLEIGNSVFMQYKKNETGWAELSQKNVDFGGGLERIAMAVQNKQDIFETDNFWPIIEKIQSITGLQYKESIETTRAMRVLADHMRASTFLAMDGVTPGNKDQGYILRRLLRRMVRAGKVLGIEKDISVSLVQSVIKNFKWLYPQLDNKQEEIETIFHKEEEKFRKVLVKGFKETTKILESLNDTSTENLAKIGFDLYQSLGYPSEIFVQDVADYISDANIKNIEQAIDSYIEEHKKLSREGAKQKFAGGLADHSEDVIKYHTATHLLHWALRETLGETVEQKGSNITGERLRFDFSHDKKLTEQEIDQIEQLINSKAGKDIPMKHETLPIEEAKNTGALHFFGEKYGDKVKVYYIGKSLENAFSKEFCGGPHVQNLNELPKMKLYKQKSIGKGLLRVYLKRTTNN